MYTIERSEFPFDIEFAIKETEEMGFWKVIELKKDYAIMKINKRFVVMIVRKYDYMFENFKSIDNAISFVYGTLI